MPRGVYPNGNKGLFKKGCPKPKNAYSWKKGNKVIHPFPKGNKLGKKFEKGHPGYLKHPNGGSFKRGQSAGENNYNWKGGISRDKDYDKNYTKKYRERNYEKVLSWGKRRRALKAGASGSHTLGEWETLKAQYNWTCPCCVKSEPLIKLTEDHIIPLTKGGSDNIENIQPLCGSCNSRKKTKTIYY